MEKQNCVPIKTRKQYNTHTLHADLKKFCGIGWNKCDYRCVYVLLVFFFFRSYHFFEFYRFSLFASLFCSSSSASNCEESLLPVSRIVRIFYNFLTGLYFFSFFHSFSLLADPLLIHLMRLKLKLLVIFHITTVSTISKLTFLFPNKIIFIVLDRNFYELK